MSSRTTQIALISSIVASLTAVVTLTVQGLTLVYEIRPALKPEPLPQTLTGKLRSIEVEPNMTWKEWKQRTGTSGWACTDVVPPSDAIGYTVYTEVETQGFKRTVTTLRCSVYSARTRRRKRVAVKGDFFEAKAGHDRNVAPIWVPGTKELNGSFVRLELYDPAEDTMLAFTDTKPLLAGPSR